MKKLMLISLLLAFTLVQVDSTVLAATDKPKTKKTVVTKSFLQRYKTPILAITGTAIAAGLAAGGIYLSPESFKRVKDSAGTKLEAAKGLLKDVGDFFVSAKESLVNAYKAAFTEQAEENDEEDTQDPDVKEQVNADATEKADDVIDKVKDTVENKVDAIPGIKPEDAAAINGIATALATDAVAKIEAQVAAGEKPGEPGEKGETKSESKSEEATRTPTPESENAPEVKQPESMAEPKFEEKTEATPKTLPEAKDKSDDVSGVVKKVGTDETPEIKDQSVKTEKKTGVWGKILKWFKAKKTASPSGSFAMSSVSFESMPKTLKPDKKDIVDDDTKPLLASTPNDDGSFNASALIFALDTQNNLYFRANTSKDNLQGDSWTKIPGRKVLNLDLISFVSDSDPFSMVCSLCSDNFFHMAAVFDPKTQKLIPFDMILFNTDKLRHITHNPPAWTDKNNCVPSDDLVYVSEEGELFYIKKTRLFKKVLPELSGFEQIYATSDRLFGLRIDENNDLCVVCSDKLQLSSLESQPVSWKVISTDIKQIAVYSVPAKSGMEYIYAIKDNGEHVLYDYNTEKWINIGKEPKKLQFINIDKSTGDVWGIDIEGNVVTNKVFVGDDGYPHLDDSWTLVWTKFGEDSDSKFKQIYVMMYPEKSIPPAAKAIAKAVSEQAPQEDVNVKPEAAPEPTPSPTPEQ